MSDNWSRADRKLAIQFLERMFNLYLDPANEAVTPYDAWSQLIVTDAQGSAVAYSALRRSIKPHSSLADWAEQHNSRSSKLAIIVAAQQTLTQS